ncbi:MAG: VOC family protein [Burkholderiaceae bacterium]
MNVQPYLFFEGRAEEALNFYTKALGTTVDMVMRNREAPEAPPPGTLPPGSEDKVMHASFHVGDTEVMLSDGFCSGQPKFNGFSLAITAADEADARRKFDAMAAGGKVTMPLGKTFWSPCFGMLTDRFGVGWMITVAPEESP